MMLGARIFAHDVEGAQLGDEIIVDIAAPDGNHINEGFAFGVTLEQQGDNAEILSIKIVKVAR